MSGQSGGGQEKTEEPTAKKRSDAKKEGQVPRSKELNTSIVLMVSALALLGMGKSMGDGMANIMKSRLTVDRTQLFGKADVIVGQFADALYSMFALFVPFMLVLLLAVLLTPVLMGGWAFSIKAAKPKWSRVSPMKGLKRIFSVKGLMELVKSALKVTLVAGVAAILIWNWSGDLLSLGRLDYKLAIYLGMEFVGWLFLLLGVATLLIAVIDVPFQIFQHTKQLKMTKQEVRDENKQTEGNPELKARVRQAQHDMAMNRMIEAIPKADVIVTNPTHYAVAIKYDEDKGGAPILLAKGVELIALKIREIAKSNGITMFEAPPLARALYYSTEVTEEIPEGLYYAVAQILAYVYQLNAAIYPEQVPDKPDELNIPKEYMDLANKDRS